MPAELVSSKAEGVPERMKLVVEAVVKEAMVVVELVVVELPVTSKLPVILKLESMVDDAVERKPLRKPKVVEVDTP